MNRKGGGLHFPSFFSVFYELVRPQFSRKVRFFVYSNTAATYLKIKNETKKTQGSQINSECFVAVTSKHRMRRK